MTKDWKRLMRKHLEEDDLIEKELKLATTPEERKEIGSRKQFNNYIIRMLAMLAVGRLGDPEK